MAGCVDGKHDKDCPLYTEEVDLIQDAECAHLAGCVDGKHDKDCPCYDLEEAECAHLEGCVDGKHDEDCPCYKVEETLALARGIQVENAIYLNQDGDDNNNGQTEENAVKTLEKAYELANDGDTIYLLSDIALPEETVLSGDKSIILEGSSDQNAPTITYAGNTSSSDDLYMIKIGEENDTATESIVTLQNVTINANKQDIRCLRVCPEAQLTLGDDAVVCNGRAVHQDSSTGCNDWGGGIVIDSGAKLTMEDGSSITGCSAEWGGAVYNSGEMEINGGEISNNTAVGDIYTYHGVDMTGSAHGGAIVLRACRADYYNSYDEPAKLVINDGEITNNSATSDMSAFGGAIAILGTPNSQTLTNELIISGGTISNNRAGYGGAISAYAADNYWQGDADIQISGDAEITDNAARNYGGAICLFGNNSQDYTSTVEMTGGTIFDNKANSKGGAVYLQANGDQFFITEGTISDNEAASGGGISINSGYNGENNEAAAYILGGLIQDNRATDGYPTSDDASERRYCGNAIDQNGMLYLNGTEADISGDIRIGCTLMAGGNGVSTNRFVTLVGAAEDMKDFMLTSYESESLDGRAVVVPGDIDYNGSNYSVNDTEPYEHHFKHNHKSIVTNTDYLNQVPTGESHERSLVLYGKQAVEITPMDITVYVGGDGYSGVIGDNGFFSGNDLPEIGFYLTLPDDMNALLGSSEEKQVDLSGIFSLTYYDTGDAGHTTRDWELELYGDESMNHATVNGQHVFIYKLMPSKINGTEEKIPLRMQFTDEDGNVMTDSKFPVNTGDEYRDYTINFYPGELNENELRATFHVNGTTVSRKIHLGSGKLRVRGNMDESYRDISNTAPSVNPQRPGLILAQTAQNNTDYYLNDTGIRVQASGVKLLVDHSLDDALLRKYIESTSNEEGKYSYQFRYLDLVDTNNGNAYVTMGAGQKMKIYWPVPADAKADTEFHIVHFVGLDRDADVDMSDLWTTHIPEEMKGKKVTIDGHSFVEFSVSSFSPFALLYEKDGTATTNPDPTPDPAPSHSSSSGHGSSSGRGSTTSSGVVIETGTQETKTPDQANALPAGTTENMLEEENTESALPKTGQEWNQSALVFFSSILLLLVTLALKKKEN